jgi:hydrogenase nickel incorporation protein HypA/HybF
VHELSLCQSIAGIVRTHAAGRPVARVHVQVGHLRQVVPDTLAWCWTWSTDGSDLAGSVLDIEEVPVAVHCPTCDAHTVLHEPAFRCGSCGSTGVRVTAGEELLVTSLELQER